jgi:hypothetical protein
LTSYDYKARVSHLPAEARKLLGVIVRQAYHGSLRSKTPGIATMPEVHEACGLDVDGMYAVLRVLCDAEVVQMTGEYPFEEIRPLIPQDTNFETNVVGPPSGGEPAI